MLPELIIREERQENLLLVLILGALSGFAGFLVARQVFPGEIGLVSVLFASIPLVYPLTKVFLEDEKNGRPHMPEIEFYGSLFAGEFLAFLLLGLMFYPEFSMQVSVFSEQLPHIGITGNAVLPSTMQEILSNNLILFFSIFAISAVIGSAGAFILTWNASVLGLFMATFVSELDGMELVTGAGQTPPPLAYMPHTIFEMSGFIVAGITGTMVSAAVYREHFDMETWKDLGQLLLTGLTFLLIGVLLESA